MPLNTEYSTECVSYFTNFYICTRSQAGDVTVAEFLCQLQKITTFPVRSFVLPLLQSSVPRLRDQLKRWLIE